MFNLNATVDNLIATVIVLLALSLVVQAVQGAVKKAFKLKSRQIEESLAHLFQFVLHNETTAQTKGSAEGAANSDASANKSTGMRAMVEQSPFLRIIPNFLAKLPLLGRRVTPVPHPGENEAYPQAAKLFAEVLNKFQAIGRTALSTRPIFDSLSKEDLLRVISSIDPEKIDHTFGGNITGALAKLTTLEKDFQTWTEVLKGFNPQNGGYLSDDDKAKLVALQAKFKPLLDSLRMLLTGISLPGAAVEKLTGDLGKLRAVDLDDIQKTLDDVHVNVVKSAEAADLNNKVDAAKALNALAAALKLFSDKFAAFAQGFKSIFANWVKLENSFDTVMQSFEERYTRGMKLAALVISLFVVVFLNANFFNIYRDISTSDAKRDMILQSREDVLRTLNKSEGQLSPSPAPPNNDPAAKAKAEEVAKAQREKEAAQTVEGWFKASRKQIDDNASIFMGYGFAPITLHDASKWLRTTLYPMAHASDKDGNPRVDSKQQQLTIWDTGDWRRYRYHDFQVLLGWGIMALLLSVGAPFWQDFLESLFGVKNVLRKGSETQNVEQKAGAGQTKQS